MVLGTYLLVSDLDLKASARYKSFADITLDDLRVLEPSLLETVTVVLFRDFRKQKGSPSTGSRQKILKQPRTVKSRYF
jgi:hypothetical protein